MSLPAWLCSQIGSRPPLTQVTGERVDAWNVAHWTSKGLNIVAGAHDRSIAERVAAEYADDIPGVFVIRGSAR